MCKETKRIIYGFLLAIGLAVCLFCVSCPFYDPGSSYGEKDRLSKDNINQFIVKAEGWERIVQDPTQFQLSNDYTFSHNNTLTLGDTAKYVFAVCNRSYGTFPAIDGSTLLRLLCLYNTC